MGKKEQHFQHTIPIRNSDETYGEVQIRTCFVEDASPQALAEYKQTIILNLSDTSNLVHWWINVEIYFLLMHGQGDSFFMPGTLVGIVKVLEDEDQKGQDVSRFVKAALTWPVFQDLDGSGYWEQETREVYQRLDNLLPQSK